MNTSPPRRPSNLLSKSKRPNLTLINVRNDPLNPQSISGKLPGEMLANACRCFSICLTALSIIVVLSCLDNAVATAQETGFADVNSEDDVRMIFSFDQTPWQSVIDFFVDQSGLSLQEFDQPPPGSFTYLDSKQHTVSEAMDILNQALLREGYTLVRNKQMLVLQRDAELNPRLVETVDANALKSRGLHEVMRVIFNVEGVQELGIEEQVRNLVSQRNIGSLRSFPSANLLIVQETGIVLREINTIIESAKKEARRHELLFRSYRMQNVDPETLLIAVRDLMEFDNDANTSRDGSIKISVEPLGKDLRIRSTEEAWEEFLEIAKMVDVPAEQYEGSQIERPTIKTYQPLDGPEIVFQVLQTNFEGREGVKMDQNPETGAIVIMGRLADHELAEQILAELGRNAPDYAFIQLENADAEDVLFKLQKFFRVTMDESSPDAPILFADAITNQINVRGTPRDVEKVKQMVADMDSQTMFDQGPRTDTRFIDMAPDEAENLMGLLPDLFPSTGRQNKIEIVMPKDRKTYRNRTIMDRGNMIQPDDQFNEDDELDQMMRELEDSDGASLTHDNETLFVSVPISHSALDELGRSSQPDRFNEDEELEKMMRKLDDSGASISDASELHYVSVPIAPMIVQEDEEVGQSSDEIKRDRDYMPPPEVESVPGADIEVKWTPEGLRLHSKDLDALDDMVSLIRERLKKTSRTENLKMFPLQYRRVEDLKPLLDRLFGLDGGGGGGGIGGAMGNVLGNAMGSAAGDLLGGMFGGSDSGASGVGIELEGEVVLEMDVPLNFLIVSGATQSDILTILDVLDILDRPNAPQQQDFVGQHYLIPIKYHDPVVVKEMIENNLPDYIKSSGNNAAANQNNPANQARAMQQMMRGMVQGASGGRGQTKTPEEEKPKATLIADERNRALILTGPEYIYEKVAALVKIIDIPEPPYKREIIPLPGFNALTVKDALLGMLGDKASVVGDEDSSSRSNSTSSRTTSSGRAPGNPNDAREAARQQIQRALQQGGGMVVPSGARGGGNRGGTNRGGTNRGGTNRGGGNRGGGNRGGGGQRN